jgi:hypothetical protein
MLRLLGAQTIGRELLAGLNEHRVIGNDVPADGEVVDILPLPPPLE